MKVFVTFMLVLVASTKVHSSSCKDSCNFVYCGGLGGIGGLSTRSDIRTRKTVRQMADVLGYQCYHYTDACGVRCNLGTVFYQNYVSDATVCPLTDTSAWRTHTDCVRKTWRNVEAAAWSNVEEAGLKDNKLDLCFQRVNEDPGLMGTANGTCEYKLVVFALDQLTNSDVPTLKAQAKELTQKGAVIHCYLMGDSPSHDPHYDDICGYVTRVKDRSALMDIIEGMVHSRLRCCPEGRGLHD